MRAPAPFNVRATALALAVLAHLLVLVLLGIERRLSRREPVVDLLQFVSIWPDMRPREQLPEPDPAREALPAPRGAAAPPRLAPVAPAVPAGSSAPSREPTAANPAERPPVDWDDERRKAAALFAATYGRPDRFSPAPQALRTPCVAPKFDKETRARMEEVQPKEPDPSPPALGVGQSSSVQMGGARVGLLRFSIPLGSIEPRGDLLDNMDDRPESSVPHGTDCD